MCFKYGGALLLAAALLLCVSCGGESDAETVVTTQGDQRGEYVDFLKGYNTEEFDVNVTFTVSAPIPVENRFRLVKNADGYVVTDLVGGKEVSYGPDMEAGALFRIAGYLPPYENAYPMGDGVYSSRIAGDLNLQKLLSGSNLFEGYTAEQVALKGECLYTAYAEGRLSRYSYEFGIEVNDSGAQFSADVKYEIEVNG